MPLTRSATTRRHFLGTTAATAMAGSLATPATGTADTQPGPAGPRKRIAIITTLRIFMDRQSAARTPSRAVDQGLKA